MTRTLYRVSKYPRSRRNSVYLFAASETDAVRAYGAMHYPSAARRDGDGWRFGSVIDSEFRAHGPRLFVVAESRQDVAAVEPEYVQGWNDGYDDGSSDVRVPEGRDG